MATLAQLVVEINARSGGLHRELDRATGAIRRMNADITRTGALLTASVTVPIVALAASVTGAAAEMDSLTRGLTAVSGSAEQTRQQLERLELVARLPGLGFREAIRGSINLQAAGLSANTAERALKAFGNALATVGRGKADLDGVTRALTQIASKARVSAEEINQLNERVPQIRQAMIAAFGTADTEVLGKQGIRSAQFIDAIIAQLEKLPPVAGGAANSFENFSDAVFRARVAIGEKLLPAIVPLVEGLANMLEKVKTLDPNVVKWGISIAAVAAVAGPLILVVGSLSTAVTALAAALAIGLLPVIVIGGPLAIALAALGALWVKNQLDALNAAAAVNAYKASLIGLTESQLRSHRIAETLRLQDAQLSRAALVRTGKNVETRVEAMGPREAVERRGIMIVPGLFAVRGATEDMRRLNVEAADAQTKIRALDAAMVALGQQSNATTSPPIIAPTSSAKADRFRGVIDQLTDSLREIQTLQMFRGVVSISLLPEDVQEQIRQVNTLTAELDKLEDGLARFRAAGREPPSGLVWGIGVLRQQLRDADAALVRLATKFNNAAFGSLRANVSAQVQPVEIGTLPRGQERMIRAPGNALDTRMAGLKAAMDAAKTNIREMGDAAKLTAVKLAEAAADVGRAIKEGIGQIAAGSSQFLGDALNMGAKLKANGKSLEKAAPAALGFAAAMEVVTGFFSVIGPVVNALTLPLRIMGEVLGLLVVPVLRILWQPLKILGIVVSYIGEVIAKVAGAIANAIGQLVKGIGKLVNKLPGSPGDPLVKAGQAMIDLGKEFKDAAKDMAARRKELQDLSFDDAVNGVEKSIDRLTESLTNVPPLFNLALRRIQAASGAGGATPPGDGGGDKEVPAFATPQSPPVTHPPILMIVMDADGNPRSEDSTSRAAIARAVKMLENVSDARAREIALAFRMAGA